MASTSRLASGETYFLEVRAPIVMAVILRLPQQSLYLAQPSPLPRVS